MRRNYSTIVRVVKKIYISVKILDTYGFESILKCVDLKMVNVFGPAFGLNIV